MSKTQQKSLKVFLNDQLMNSTLDPKEFIELINRIAKELK